MKDDFKNINFYASLVIASLVFGGCIVFSAKLISHSIEISSLKLRQDILKDIKELDEAKMKANQPEEAFKPGEKIVEGVTAGTNPIKGDLSAPVLIVECSDFECPFSKRFYQSVFPQIDKEYISTGKVKFAYRDFPLPFHTFAKDAAIASRCAAKQNKYWEMFDKLSTNNQVDAGSIQKYASRMKLNMKLFNSCLKDDAIKGEIEKESSDIIAYGVRGTPAFFVNGRFIEGALPFNVFKEIIDTELNNTDNKK